MSKIIRYIDNPTNLKVSSEYLLISNNKYVVMMHNFTTFDVHVYNEFGLDNSLYV